MTDIVEDLITRGYPQSPMELRAADEIVLLRARVKELEGTFSEEYLLRVSCDRELSALKQEQPFTTKELAQEILLWLSRDVPNTVVHALRHILAHYIETGIYDDKRIDWIGNDPVLSVQRFNLEFDRLNDEIATLKQQAGKAVAMPDYEWIANKLITLGWRSSADAQWDHLKEWWQEFTNGLRPSIPEGMVPMLKQVLSEAQTIEGCKAGIQLVIEAAQKEQKA